MPDEQDEPLDVKSEMDKTMLVVRCLLDLPIAELINNIERCHTVMPLIDPTRYRDGLNNVVQQSEVLNPLLVAQRKLQNVTWLMEAIERAHAVQPQ